MGRKLFLIPAAILALMFSATLCFGDEQDLFKSNVAPDALIILDLSGSMREPPSGNIFYVDDTMSCGYSGEYDGPFYTSSGTGHTLLCSYAGSSGPYPVYSTSACAGPFYITAQGSYNTNCSKIGIAKQAIKSILDANADGTIDGADETSLGVRIGYMHFYNDIPASMNPIGTHFIDIWNTVNGESAIGGTPLASTLDMGKNALDNSKSGDLYSACRNKFVIVITDGEDTRACSGNGSNGQVDQYRRRRETVAAAKRLADAGYRTFFIGLGTTMPHFMLNTLNWAATFGGTAAVSPPPPLPSSPYDPGSVTACQISSYASHDLGEGSHYYATSNDPGEIPLSGYALTAADQAEMSRALQTAFAAILSSTFFSGTSVAAARSAADDAIYLASFEPKNDPFWAGHLQKFRIQSDGTIDTGSPPLWDAGAKLKNQATRNIYTYVDGNVTLFNGPSPVPWGQWKNYFNTDLDTAKLIVPYIRGEITPTPPDGGWKLGDAFHSNPVSIGYPSIYFNDIRSPNAYDQFRDRYTPPSSSARPRIIVAGSNDGQFHAFSASDGIELWSFIPPNLLPKLKYLAHSSDPAPLSQTHTYFVDGPVTVTDVWLGTGNGISPAKARDDWHTLLVFGEGRGVESVNGTTTPYLWSHSSSCDLEFNPVYTAYYSNYCGYYAFDLTDTSKLPPDTFKWRINGFSAAQAAYLGEPWSRMAIGRVMISGNEKWVGFIGGGFNRNYLSPSPTDLAGKNFFVVDLSNGNVLWSYPPGTDNSIAAPPAIVDTDGDGFIDTVYVGDLSGNMWRFTFCIQSEMEAGTCTGPSQWGGGKLYAGTGTIYTKASVARDSGNHLWVYWGTGDKQKPNDPLSTDSLFAVKDDDRATTVTGLQDISNPSTPYNGAAPGWYITLPGTGEKMLADPMAFVGVLYFTTYVAPTGACNMAGKSYLYELALEPLKINGNTYFIGSGIFTAPGGDRSVLLGTGIASAPTLSQKPSGGPTDVFTSVSGGTGATPKIDTSAGRGNPNEMANLNNAAPHSSILHWKDQRILP